MPDIPLIEFNEAEHIYTVDGRVRASVTDVLSTLIKVEQFSCYVDTTTGANIAIHYIEDAGDFGRGVHKAAKFTMEGAFFKFPDELAHPVSELERWIKDNDIVPVDMEFKGYSPKLDVAGTMDLVCRSRAVPNQLNLVDYKTAKESATVGPQTWAYEQIYRAMTGYRGVIKRWVLYLPKKEGSYRFIELRSPMDEHAFKSANYLYHWHRR